MDLVDQLSRRGLDCLCGNLRMAARAVSSVYDRHLADAGIQASQMAVLWAVSSAGGISVKELAARLAMHETTPARGASASAKGSSRSTSATIAASASRG